jgi:hypothetical protein
MDREKYAAAHLDLRLSILNRACRLAVGSQQSEAALLDRPDLADRCITDRQVEVLMDRVERRIMVPAQRDGVGQLTEADRLAEDDLRVLAQEAGTRFPLDALAEHYKLGELERQALIAVAAPELDGAYERIYAYVCDEFDRRFPSVELLMSVTGGICDRYGQRIRLSPLGILRRCRLMLPYGDAPTDLRQQLRLAPGVLELLLGGDVDVGAVGNDPGQVDLQLLPSTVIGEPHDLEKLAAAMVAGEIDSVCIWSTRPGLTDAACAALASGMRRPLRRVPPLAGMDREHAERALRLAVSEAGLSHALLWLDLTDLAEEHRRMLESVVFVLSGTRHPVVVTAAAPWYPPDVLANRRWAGTEATADHSSQSKAYWSDLYGDITVHEAETLAAQFPLSPVARTAAAHLADSDSSLTRNPVTAEAVQRACAAVSAPSAGELLRLISPQRGPDQLVLSPPLEQQVLEIADLARSVPVLETRWSETPVWTKRSGYKALFTGDPGTGKTLAAEVIASCLGVQLVKVDLSRIVSKWVGETAKHLDEVFQATTGSSAVLFFDEADALFGKRGGVEHGTDRYANTEVSHLLQQFEEHPGLVILASNLRENIDIAFARRFHAVVHFSRPEKPERRRLWELALPLPAGRGTDVDTGLLATLDMTGAGIFGAVRTAGLIAVAAGEKYLTMNHIIQGAARQYRAEGRLFPSGDIESGLNFSNSG